MDWLFSGHPYRASIRIPEDLSLRPSRRKRRESVIQTVNRILGYELIREDDVPPRRPRKKPS